MLHRYKSTIVGASEVDIKRDPTIAGGLVLDRQGNLTCSYAPFEHVHLSARVVLVGITPGALQASNALISARRELLAGNTDTDMLAKAKVFASFSGAMRSNLVAMLDAIGVAKWLGIGTTSELWDRQADLAHFTSALRYPVFVDGANYAGSPPIGSVPMLRRLVEDCLASEASALPNAIWVPLGPVPALALGMLEAKGLLASSHVLRGLPHPSGANAERVAYFLGRKEKAKLSAKTNASSIDAAREGLIAKIAAL